LFSLIIFHSGKFLNNKNTECIPYEYMHIYFCHIIFDVIIFIELFLLPK
jgi:hypothetical protein